MSEDQRKYAKSLTKLKKKILGNFSTTIDQIDDVLTSFNDKISNKDSQNYSELLRTLFSDRVDSSFFENSAINLYEDISYTTRMSRYKTANDIEEHIPYCARALKVLSDGIISPDNITKDVIQILEDRDLTEQEHLQLSDVRTIKDTLELDEFVNEIISPTLKYGDTFVEICDFMSKDVPVSQSLLNESGTHYYDEKIIESVSWDEISKPTSSYPGAKVKIEKFNTEIEVELVESKNPNDISDSNFNENERSDLSRIRLITHDPSKVVKIQSKNYKMNLGYLVIPENYVIGNFGLLGNPNSFWDTQNVVGVDAIYRKLIKKISTFINGDVKDSSNIQVNKNELSTVLQRAIKEIEADETGKKKLTIRYVPPTRMEHLFINRSRYFPYGEGIFQKVAFQAKLLIALETAVTVKRIGESSEKRAFYIESALPRNLQNVIEQLKMSLKKRKHSIDTLGNISSIPSSITSFEDFYIPTKQGKRFVEIESIQPTTNIRDITEELKFFRDSVVAILEVPPAFINIEENLSNKSALAHENELFARTIISYQSIITKNLRSIFSKVYKMVHGKTLSTGIKITFSAPRMLQIERESETIETSVRIIQSLQELGIPREYLKRKYLSMNWEEIDEYIAKYNLENKSKQNVENEDNPDFSMGGSQSVGGMGGSQYGGASGGMTGQY